MILEWIENHMFEHEDGTWSRSDDQGEPVGERFKTEDALLAHLWDSGLAEEAVMDGMIIAAVRLAFPSSKIDAKHMSWYRNVLRRGGR